MSATSSFASARTLRVSGRSRRMWSREASSGTTPPYSACIATCECSAWPTSPRPVSYRATPVSSQEVSMPRTTMARRAGMGEGRGGRRRYFVDIIRGFFRRLFYPRGLMPTVRVKENEPFEVALRRFKRTVEKTGLLTELRSREFYEKPTAERKRKLAAAVKRHHKRLRSQMLPAKLY